jgi:hypothetical protein
VTDKDNQRQRAATPDDREAEKNKPDPGQYDADQRVLRLTERLAGKDHHIVILEQTADGLQQLTHELRVSNARLENENDALRARIAELESEGRTCGCSQDAGGGVVVILPHMTPTFEIVFDVYREFWPPRDPRRPPKSTNVAHAIDARLGWKSHRNGSPSRSAQAFAAAMRPDELAATDGRNQKRRARRELPPRSTP